jgi:hypothetical protein
MNSLLSTLLFIAPLFLAVEKKGGLERKEESCLEFDAKLSYYNFLENKVEKDTVVNDSINVINSTFFDNVLLPANLSCGGLDEASSTDLGSGYLVLKKGFELVESNFKMSGSCWSYANKLYDFAGFTQGKRKVVSSAKKGTLLKDPSLIMPGDWLFHVNYSFRNVEHSAIFVCWKDKANLLAITLSHVGQNKYAGGSFGVYDLKGVYQVTRAIDLN